LLVFSDFSRADHSISQVLTTCSMVLSLLLLKACFKSLHVLFRPPLIGPTAMTSHAAVTNDARRPSIQISKYSYVLKQACKQLQYNKAKLSEPASINVLHIYRGLGARILITHIRRKYRWVYRHCYRVNEKALKGDANTARWLQ